jgi:tetratricopeptide (TPR) repeat protein
MPRALREQHEKGVTALQRQNFDYAISLLNQVLAKEPTCYETREALRAAQLKKTGGATSFFKKMIGSANPQLARGQLALRSSPLEAIAIAESILNGDPQNTAAHKLLADAALAADMPRTAALSLEIAFKAAPSNRDVAIKLATALARAGQVTKGERIISELLQQHPHDIELAQTLKNLSAHRTLEEGGYEALSSGEGSYRDVLKDKAEAAALEQEHRQVKADDVAAQLIEEYETRLKSDPGNSRLLRSIAELYTQKAEFDRAIECYGRLAELESGADPSLERAITETTLRKLDQAIERLDPGAPDYAPRVAQLRAERQEYLLGETRRRVEKYPSDLQLRFDLGQVYFQMGRVSEAIQEFQKAQANPHRRIPALHFLGRCFGQRGMHDLAVRTLQMAIREKLVFDDEKKELIYDLGCAFERLGQAAQAMDQFKLIYETDIGYRDVAAKVDAFYAAQQQGPGSSS